MLRSTRMRLLSAFILSTCFVQVIQFHGSIESMPDGVQNMDIPTPRRDLFEEYATPALKTVVARQGWKCSLRYQNRTAESPRRKQLATVVVFQSNSGDQLRKFVSHYSRVIGMENIVIIDHHPKGRVVDPYSASLLEEYIRLGSDVWLCDGSFGAKREMWSDVTTQYANTSEFVFPLDVDEYLAVLKPKLGDSRDIVIWNFDAFADELLQLPHTGQPFKMERGNIFPADCWNFTWPGMEMNIAQPSRVRYVGRRKELTNPTRCQDKVFFRSKEFEWTDTGNHHGKTRGMAQIPCYESIQHTSIYMVHSQYNNFDEWLLHGLRGSSVRDFNKFVGMKQCTDKMVSRHYCVFWKELIETKMDPWKMRKLYRERVCKPITETSVPVSLAGYGGNFSGTVSTPGKTPTWRKCS
ncbi:hypothetical protein ACHAWF_008475 [Thalassiosira exigua]